MDLCRCQAVVQLLLCSLNFSEQIPDLLLGTLVEGLFRIAVPNYAHFEVSLRHLALKGVLESFDGSMHSITDVHIICVGLLEEGTSLCRAPAQGSGLPAVESA